MKHLKQLTSVDNVPKAAMGAGDVLMIIGTILASTGSVLMGISPFFGAKG